MAARQRGDGRVDFIRRLVLARCPEITLDDLEAAFGHGAGPDRAADALAEIADAIVSLEKQLTELERGLPWRVP
jgi:hypothetical protein